MFRYFFDKILWLFWVVIAFLFFVLYTEPGLYVVFYAAKRVTPGNLSYSSLHGYLLGDFTIEKPSYTDTGLNIHADKLSLKWQPLSLIHRHFDIQSLNIERLKIIEGDVEHLHATGYVRLAENLPLSLCLDWKLIYPKTLGKLQVKGDALNYGLTVAVISPGSNPLQVNLMGNIENIWAPQPTFAVLAAWKDVPVDTMKTLGSANVAGSLSDYEGQLNAVLQTVDKKNYPVSATINTTEKKLQAKITAGDKKLMFGDFSLQGQHNPQLNLNWTLNLPQLSNFSANPAELSGQVVAQGKIQNLAKNLVFTARTEGRSIKYQTIYLKNIQSDLNIQHIQTKQMSIDLDTQIKPGDLMYDDGTEKKPIVFRKADLHLYWMNNILKAKTEWIFDAAKRFDGEATIRPFELRKFDPKHLERHNLSGELKFEMTNLDFLNDPKSQLKKIQGALLAKFKLSGTLAKPFWNGDGSLKASGEIPDLGLVLDHVNVNLKSSHESMQLKGEIVSGHKTLLITGESSEPFPQAFKAKIKGDNFLLMNTEEYQIYASPDLDIQWGKNTQEGKSAQGAENMLTINGKVDIPSAKIWPLEFSQTVELPSDVVFVSDKKEAALPLQMESRVMVNLGNNVDIKTHGLTGKLTGSVMVVDETNEPTTGEGEIRIVDGKYDAYGQKLKIETGLITFGGGPIDNPQLLVRATRSFDTTNKLSPISNSPIPTTSRGMPTAMPLTQADKITVGVEIVGYLANPVIRLFSVPATLSQSDILSFLILGRPMAQASSADATLLLRALSALNLGGGQGTQITQQLQRTFGLDVFNVETHSQYDPSQNLMKNSTSLVIGKALSTRLFVDYSIGLMQGNNILRVKYILAPRWILQTETDAGDQGVDLLYSFSRQ